MAYACHHVCASGTFFDKHLKCKILGICTSNFYHCGKFTPEIIMIAGLKSEMLDANASIPYQTYKLVPQRHKSND
jgi:hypothetical protein